MGLPTLTAEMPSGAGIVVVILANVGRSCSSGVLMRDTMSRKNREQKKSSNMLMSI